MSNPLENKKAKFVKGRIELRSLKSPRNAQKALDKAKQPGAIKALHQMAHKERRDNGMGKYEKEHGTFEDRLKKYAEYQKKK